MLIFFFLQGVLVGRAVAQDLDGIGVQLKGLLGLRGEYQSALDAQAAVQAGVDDFVVVCQLAGFQHHLQGLEAAAVRQGDEADVLGVTDVLGPAADGQLGAVGGGVLEQRDDLGTFHSNFPPIKIKRQLCPEFSGRTSCLVMSAVPPELPEVSGRSRAHEKGSAAPLTLGLRRTYWRQKLLPGFRLQLPGVRSRTVRSRLAADAVFSGSVPGCVTFPDPCCFAIKIAQRPRFVNRLFVGKQLNSAPANGIMDTVAVCPVHRKTDECRKILS